MYEAFFLLSAGRQFNETGVQPITFSDIVAFLNDRRIEDLEERAEFQHLLRVMDGRYLELTQAKIQRERDRLKNKSSQGKVPKKGR